MKNFKFLILLIVMSLAMSSISLADMTQYQKANALSDINMFKGTDKGYNLPAQLKRSEAATLIVGLMGEKEHVLKNKSKYSKSIFSDIKAGDWYTPYVVYCYEHGLILGASDGTYKPNEYISEKDFAKLVLGVLGYKYGKDFTDYDIKKFLYEKKLVDDIQYTINSDNNTKYTRGDAVELLYNSLDKKIKGKDKTIIEVLVDKKVASTKTAKKYDLIRVDNVLSDIVSVKVIDKDTLQVEMNEPITVRVDDIDIYAGYENLVIKDFKKEKQILTIDVDGELYNDRNFSIGMAKVYDDDDNVVKNLEKKFNGIEREELVSESFIISKIRPISSKMVEVRFTQPIDKSAEQVLLYEVYRNGMPYFKGGYKTLDVELNKNNDRSVILRTKGHTFDKGSNYELKIRADLQSKYKVRLNNGKGDSYIFRGSDNVYGKFTVEEVNIVDIDNIEVIFSELVDKDSALSKKNYSIKDEENRKLSVSEIYLDEYDDNYKGRRVILKTSKMKEGRDYRISLYDVKNIFGTSGLTNFSESLGEAEDDQREITLDSVEVLNRMHIQLKFEEPLAKASERASINIKGVGIKKKSINESNPKILDVYLSKGRPLREDRDYELVIKRGLKDIYGNTNSETIEEEFSGTDEYPDDITIDKAYFISDSQVLIKFSEVCDKSSLGRASNYNFTYDINGTEKKLIIGNIEVVDEKTVIVVFDYLLPDGKMYVKVNDIYDVSGQYRYGDLRENVGSLNQK